MRLWTDPATSDRGRSPLTPQPLSKLIIVYIDSDLFDSSSNRCTGVLGGIFWEMSGVKFFSGDIPLRWSDGPKNFQWEKSSVVWGSAKPK